MIAASLGGVSENTREIVENALTKMHCVMPTSAGLEILDYIVQRRGRHDVSFPETKPNQLFRYSLEVSPERLITSAQPLIPSTYLIPTPLPFPRHSLFNRLAGSAAWSCPTAGRSGRQRSVSFRWLSVRRLVGRTAGPKGGINWEYREVDQTGCIAEAIPRGDSQATHGRQSEGVALARLCRKCELY